jgi:hypothetical protein
MPHYYFGIRDGHRLVDPSGLNFKNEDDAIAKAKVIAIGVSLARRRSGTAHCCSKWFKGGNFQGAGLFQTAMSSA